MITTAVILNTTDTTPTIAIFCSIPMFLFNAKIEVSKRHPKFKNILYKLPLVFSSSFALLSYNYTIFRSCNNWQIKAANTT